MAVNLHFLMGTASHGREDMATDREGESRRLTGHMASGFRKQRVRKKWHG